jgi:hypothetical protein
MTTEQGLSLPETMVSKEDALEALYKFDDWICDNFIHTPELDNAYETIRQFIEQQTKGLNQ